MPTNNSPERPAAKLRLSRIVATIWRNRPTDEGIFYSVQITRIYRQGLNWNSVASFGRDDLLTVAKIADMANTRIHEFEAAERNGSATAAVPDRDEALA